MTLATNNAGKLREIKSILADYEIYSLREKNIDIDIEENQDSFYGNALKKAKEIYEISHEPVIADDSGLCIDCFDGWPGVLTHRFLGNESTEKERNIAILEKMKDCNNRDASVVCNLVYYDGINILNGEGIIKGKISDSRRGVNGFGFDEIFEMSNGKTLAELTSEEKNKISARYLAANDLKMKLSNLK